MIKFRNPGTQYATHIRIIKQLYSRVGTQAFFTLGDMAIAITQAKLMTAYGYSGDEAIKLSKTEQESMNSTLMNVKMYAELFRMLGWIVPYNENSSYPLVFTYIGVHIALSENDCHRLYEQSVLGINNPTQFNDNMRYNERTRFFKCALRTLIDLDGIMYKHELCLGPMNINDKDENAYQNMLLRIRSLRGSQKRLKDAFAALAANLNMGITSVDNSTRTPIGLMKNCGWVESVDDKTLYGRSMTCIRITPHGREIYEALRNMYDLRLEEYENYEPAVQDALIRLGTYSILERSGYDVSEVQDIMQADRIICAEILDGKALLFSPCATLRRNRVEAALGVRFGVGSTEYHSIDTFQSTTDERANLAEVQVWDLNIPEGAATELLTEPEDFDFLDRVDGLKREGCSSSAIVSTLFKYYVDATQTTFYPLIATLFKVIGFNCSFSRPGDNGARWDAIIDDPARSIPIEIKSPTEEQHLSIKAIRQALENKIVLLSRGTHITAPEVTTLAVGYLMPNERAEVSRLISDIKATYGYKIGVIDLHSLLSLAISTLVDERGFDKEKLYGLEGLMNANILRNC